MYFPQMNANERKFKKRRIGFIRVYLRLFAEKNSFLFG